MAFASLTGIVVLVIKSVSAAGVGIVYTTQRAMDATKKIVQ